MAHLSHADIRPESIERNDSVRVPDGRIGEVIGFYLRANESVVVQFPSGRSGEYLTSEVRHSVWPAVRAQSGSQPSL